MIEPIYRIDDNRGVEEIAQGFEITKIVTGQTDNETISWSELRLVIRSINNIDAFKSTIEQHRSRYRDKPARVEIKPVLEVHVQDNELAIKTAI